MRPFETFSFFIFLTTFSFFHSPLPSFLFVPPSSSFLLPPRPSFLLVPVFFLIFGIKNKTRRSTMRPQATFSFFIFFYNFFIFSLSSSLLPPRRSFLRIPPYSSSLLPPRPSFLLVPPSSLSLFLPRPALSESFRIRKWPFFIDLDESVTNQPTDRPTDGQGLI